ncbi:MAG TPA: TIGR01440 family protein [Syntrophomonadaceae bacterium]|nr:TIGR01440 family protein [Syntrophomonadaceae bacterium]
MKEEINIISSLTQTTQELLQVANLKTKQILVIGCSTSEVLGHHIGQKSSLDIAQQVMDVILPLAKGNKIFLAIQTCEHLNRALVVEEECAMKYNLEIVSVLPHEKAGGSLASSAMARFVNPVVVENIKGHAGIDIGDTFIGMHLKPVVVPVRSTVNKIGHAHLTMARTRPKFIGGARAKYLK